MADEQQKPDPRPLKGLFSDTKPLEQIPGTYPFGKNGIQGEIINAVINEPGFTPYPMPPQLPYYNTTIDTTKYKVIGGIETDVQIVLFLSDNADDPSNPDYQVGYSLIVYFDYRTNLYSVIFSDTYFPSNIKNPYRLGFNQNYYITGQYQRNYLNQIIVAFTDKYNPPFYLNCDKPNVFRYQDWSLFPFFVYPNPTSSFVSGGGLLQGTYFYSLQFQRYDGTTTQYTSIFYAGLLNQQNTLPTVSTGKALNISITNGDPTFDLVLVYIISKISGVTSAVALAPIVMLNGTANIIYTSLELDSSPATLQDILTPSVIYSQVGTIGQLNDILYIGNLKINDYNNLQLVANNIKIAWVSSLIQGVDTLSETYQDPNDNSPLSNIYQGKTKGFQHEEIYAFYIRFILSTGETTKAFHIPGNSAITYQGSGLPLSENNNPALGLNALNLKLNNTTVVHPSFAYDDYLAYRGIIFNGSPTSSPSGNTGIWYSNEQYDITDPYISKIANDGLGNYNVRLHKMPTIRYCYNNIYAPSGVSPNSSYGITALDMLGVQASGQDDNGNQIDILTLVTNLVNKNLLPVEYNSILSGYEILYAERGLGNISVMGQSLSLYNFYQQNTTPVNSVVFHSSLPNINSVSVRENNSTTPITGNNIIATYDVINFHSFDILLNKPQANYNHLSQQLLYSVNLTNTLPGNELLQNRVNATKGLLTEHFLFTYNTVFLNLGWATNAQGAENYNDRGPHEGSMIGLFDLTNNGVKYLVTDGDSPGTYPQVNMNPKIISLPLNDIIKGISLNNFKYVNNTGNSSNTVIPIDNAGNKNYYILGTENHLVLELNNTSFNNGNTCTINMEFTSYTQNSNYSDDFLNNMGQISSRIVSMNNSMLSNCSVYLSNILSLNVSQYNSVFNQKLVETEIIFFNPNNNGYAVSYKGDVFLNNYSFQATSSFDPIFNTDNNTDGANTPNITGNKVVYRFICESINPIFLRKNNVITDVQGNTPDRVYNPLYLTGPKVEFQAPLDNTQAIYNWYWSIYNDPNTWQGYYTPTNSQNDINNVVIYVPGYIQPTEFPYRIARSTKLSLQNAFRSWRNFLPLDFYEMQKNYGPVIALNGMTDKMMIHMLNALFYTRDKAAITGNQGTGLPITLTTTDGDIFQFEPQQVQESKLGYLGVLSDLSCNRNPAGYFYVDTRVGEVYLFVPDVFRVGQNKYLNEGNNIFLRKYLQNITTNNSYIGNGVFFGYDQKYKRVLMTCKNKIIKNLPDPSNVVIVTDDNYSTVLPANFPPNTKIALYNGNYYTVSEVTKSCPGPVTILISSITTNSALITFAYLGQYVCQYILNITLLNGSSIYTSNVPQGNQGDKYVFTINNLNCSTTYNVSVTPDCTCNGLQQPGAVAQTSFNTLVCPPPPPPPPDPFRLGIYSVGYSIVDTYTNQGITLLGSQPVSSNISITIYCYGKMRSKIPHQNIQTVLFGSANISINTSDSAGSIVNKLNVIIQNLGNSAQGQVGSFIGFGNVKPFNTSNTGSPPIPPDTAFWSMELSSDPEFSPQQFFSYFTFTYKIN